MRVLGPMGLGESEVQVSDAGAEFEVADGEGSGVGGGAAEKFEVQGYGVGLVEGGVSTAHVLARDEEEERGDVAAVGDGTDAPGVFENGFVGVRREGFDGCGVGKGKGHGCGRLLLGRFGGERSCGACRVLFEVCEMGLPPGQRPENVFFFGVP